VSSTSAALLVVGLILVLVFGLPGLWWIFYRMDATHVVKNNTDTEILPKLLTADDIKKIESVLGLSLPNEYLDALTKPRSSMLDGTTMLDSAEQIIESTLLYRNGFSGLPKWPSELIYFGDEADACPYAINCESGVVIKLDKGNIEKEPLAKFGQNNRQSDKHKITDSQIKRKIDFIPISGFFISH
jgi:SMI1/KNR4 family protein SUKH-1